MARGPGDNGGMRRPEETRAARAPVVTRRRLRPRFGLLLLIALLVLIGQGIGLLGDGGKKPGEPAPEAKATATGAAAGPGEAKPAAPAVAPNPASGVETRSDP